MDHVIAEKHDGPTDEGNLCLACVVCNQLKGSDLSSLDPETQALVPLYNPRRQDWSDHFQLLGARIEALTPVGRVTVRLLQLNNPERIQERELLVRARLLHAPARS